jgi:hypothetical protein
LGNHSGVVRWAWRLKRRRLLIFPPVVNRGLVGLRGLV